MPRSTAGRAGSAAGARSVPNRARWRRDPGAGAVRTGSDSHHAITRCTAAPAVRGRGRPVAGAGRTVPARAAR